MMRPLQLTRLQRRAALGVTLILSLVAAAYAARGFHALTLAGNPNTFSGGGCDMQMRWSVMHYILRGKNPREIYDRCRAAERAHSNPSHCEGVEPDLGPPAYQDYPPWAYFTAIALMWPSGWQAARAWYAGVNVLAIAVMGTFAYRVGRCGGKETACLFAAATLAMGSICGTLVVGQFGPIVAAALIAALWLDEGGHPVLAGIAVGVGLFKPTLSVPFLIPFLVKRRWTVLAAAGIYIALGSCFVWWRSGVNPLVMLHNMQEAPIRDWKFTGSHDLLSLMGLMGWDKRIAINMTAVTVMALAFGLLVYWRNASMLYLFAIAAMAARLWTYHRYYDDTILVFLLAAVGEAAIRGRSRVGTVTFAVLGASLWLPQRIVSDEIGLGVAIWLPMILVWLAATGVLLAIAPRHEAASAMDALNR